MQPGRRAGVARRPRRLLARRTRAALHSLDLRLLRLLRTRCHSPRLESAVVALARTGESGLIWYALAVAMAVSRPYLGAHYPSDVVAGAILGDAVAALLLP